MLFRFFLAAVLLVNFAPAGHAQDSTQFDLAEAPVVDSATSAAPTEATRSSERVTQVTPEQAAAPAPTVATGSPGNSPVVVELFTSQGCSSCPPADALFAELAALPGVIALALHVDYWDYLGWKDEYGTAMNSARQRAYAKKARARSIFTPQIIVQGTDPIKGHDAKRVRAAIDNHRGDRASARLDIARDGDLLRIDLAPAPRSVLRAPASVHVVSFLPSDTVEIQGGENAGRKVTYSNIVTSWETVADWDGLGPLQLVYRTPTDGPIAVIIQDAATGPVLTAARLP